MRTAARLVLMVIALTLTACSQPTATPSPEVLADCFLNYGLTAWDDANGDGVRNNSEQPLQGVNISVSGPFAHVFSGPEVITDETGHAAVSGWQPGTCIGEFSISATAPSGYTLTTDSPVTVAASAAPAKNIEFGFRKTDQ